MKIHEFARAIIECNTSAQFLYNFCLNNAFYEKFLNNKIQKRIDYINKTKNIKFMIETSSICNASCIFCPYKTMQREKQVMPDNIFNTIIERIKNENINPTSFDLFMIGEPFTDKKIFDRINILKNNFPAAAINITSNFGMVNNEIIEKLVTSPVNFINISLNAAEEKSYEEIMKLDYNKTINNINLLLDERKKHKSKLKIGLSMVLCLNNKNQAWKFFSQWHHKVDTIRFQREAEWIDKNKLFELSQYKKNKLYPCNDIFERFPIFSNGDYAFCCQDSEGMIKLNVNATPIWDAFNSDFFNKMRNIHLNKNISDLDMCKKCFGVNSNGANWIFTSR